MDGCNVAVRYFSKSGNTKKLADAIAKTAGCNAQEISTPLDGNIDILFLGASVYWGGISSEVKSFIVNLDSSKVGKVVVFSTSALAERAFPQIQELFKKNGIKVDKNNFYCRGQFTALHRGRPNNDDLEAAKKFTLKVLKGE
ncbi:MAG: flavodoxin [Ruminococcus sp.]|nr:flavodoxin [Ruminococcus sp.]